MASAAAGQLDAFDPPPAPAPPILERHVEQVRNGEVQPIARARLAEPRRAKPTQLPPLSDRQRERLDAIAQLQGLVLPGLEARALARKDAEEAPGVTGDDVHALLDEHPQAVLLGSSPKARSWIGPWLASLARRGRLAPLVVAGMKVKRASARPEAHGNPQVVYLHPDDRRVRS